MTLTPAHVSPFIALIAGILILIMPRFLNFIVCHLPYLDRAHGAERHLSFHPLIAQRSPHRSAIAARTKPQILSVTRERAGASFMARPIGFALSRPRHSVARPAGRDCQVRTRREDARHVRRALRGADGVAHFARGDRITRCPLLAQSGHTELHCTCPLLGLKRTCAFASQNVRL